MAGKSKQTTRITPIGVYKIRPDKEAYDDALETHENADYVKKELGSVVYVELKIENSPKTIDIYDFKQSHTEYVPYDVKYYSVDYRKVLAKAFNVPKVRNYIVCFFLHFYDPEVKLNTPFGEMRLPPTSKLPDRFESLKYVFWD